MRVLCLTNMFPTADEPWTGVFVAEQVEDVRRLGVEVEVCRFDGRKDSKEYLRAAGTLRRTLASDRFDLVHAHYGLTGAVALAQHRAPIVTTFWGSDTFVPWQRRVSYVVARLTVPLFVSAQGRASLRRPDAVVVPSAVDTKRFRPRPRVETRRLLGWDEDGVYVLLPGPRSSPMKNAALFDATLNALPGGVRARPVSLEGYSREEAALAISAADVTLMTSRSEGSPVAVRESLACETPVVSVAVGDVPELLRGLPGCAVCERDPAALARGVLHALDAGRSLALRARVEEYSRERVAARILDVYEQALRR